MNLLIVFAASVAVIVMVHGTTFLIARRIGRYNIVDITWGLGFVAVAAVAAILGDGDLLRRLLLLALTAVWGLRLAWHMYVKTKGHGEDPRYRDLLAGNLSPGNVIRKIFGTQAIATLFIAAPLVLSATQGPGPSVVMGIGVAVWLAGLIFEALGDHQLRAFKGDPANKGKIMDRGLWSWTRHPNYFGDACVWWGLWLVSITGWVSLATVVSPVVMTYFLVHVTGARLTERYMKDRPGFREYCTRTSYFVPLPPK